MGLEHNKENDKSSPTSNSEVAEAFHNSVSMTHPAFNQLDLQNKSECLAGPNLNDLHIDGTDAANKHFQEIAHRGADNIAIDGNFQIAARHAFDSAHADDAKHGGGYQSIDAVLSYMNKELCHGPYSLTRNKDNVILLDSRDGDRPKHDQQGKAILHPRETYDLKTKKLE